MRSWLRTILVLVLTVGLLAFFFRDANFAEVWAETRRANPWLLLLAILVTGFTYALRAWRWQSLLAPIGRTHFGTAFRATVIGFAASFLLPARAGEVIRPYVLARKEGLKPTAAFATIILERLLDIATVLLLFGAFVFTVPDGVLAGDESQLAYVKFWGGIAAAAAVGGLVILGVLAGHPERLGRAAGRIERVLPARVAQIVARFVESFAQGLAVLRDPARLAVALLQSFPLWLSIASGIWLTSQAFHITFPFTGSFLVMTLLVVGVAAPTPGQIGGFHAAYQIAVQTFFNAPADRAVGAAIVLHAISFVPVTILGVVFMTREGLTLSTAKELAGSGTP
ncbi:MAG: lysylphosphatidylglycerol synthase transmembrane domain-containing protein [Vicinamibacterales bacterium]